MQSKSLLAVISVAATLGLATLAPVEAGGWCRGAPAAFCGPPPVSHFIYYPQYTNVYYWATIAPYPGAYAYMPRGYYRYYDRPYARYARRYWYRRPRYGYAPAYVPTYPVPVAAAPCCDGARIK